MDQGSARYAVSHTLIDSVKFNQFSCLTFYKAWLIILDNYICDSGVVF